MSETVGFTRMDQGTFEDYQILDREYRVLTVRLADEVLGMLKRLQGEKLGYPVDRYEHSLQTATRAYRDGADEEMVCAALLHDIGDTFSPENHAAVAAGVLRPYMTPDNHWLVEHHAIFQGYYYWHHLGQDRDTREKYRGHPMFETTAAFCEKWDQRSFDPHFDTMPLDAFEPMVRRLFAQAPWRHAAKA